MAEEMETIVIGGKEIQLADINEEAEEDFAPSENEAEIEGEEEDEVYTMNDLDENDPIDYAAKKCFEAALTTGKIPLAATDLGLVLTVGYLDSKTNKRGEIKWDRKEEDFEIKTIKLLPEDRITAVEGLASSWVDAIKDILYFQKKFGETCSEEQMNHAKELQSKYDSALSDFRNALKFLLSTSEDRKVTGKSVGGTAVAHALSEIRKMKNEWAFDQFMLLPKPYITFAVFNELPNNANAFSKQSAPVTNDDDFSEGE